MLLHINRYDAGLGFCTRIRRDFRQTEVQNFCNTPIGDKNIARLDIPVNDPFRVCGVECVRDLDSPRQDHLDLQRSPRDAVCQSHPGQKFHRDESLAVLFTNVIDGADVGMVQGRCCFGLASKPLQCLAVLGDGFRQKLKGHEAVKPGVFRLIDHTHPATAELFDNPVVRYGSANQIERAPPQRGMLGR